MPNRIVSDNVFCFKYIMVLIPFFRAEDINKLAEEHFSRITSHLGSCIFPMKRSSLIKFYDSEKREERVDELRKTVSERIELVEWVQLQR